MADESGQWFTTPGAGGLVVFKTPTAVVTIWSPKDGTMTGLEFTPDPAAGDPLLALDAFEFNLSNVVAAYDDQVASVISATQTMTQAQAEVWIQNANTAGEIAPAVADVMLRAFVPTLPVATP
jgi:hypothetical protein